MADPKHVAAVQAGYDALCEWQRDNHGIPLDLHAADLRGINIADHFDYADMSWADLRGANIASDLVRANLRETNLEGAIFEAKKVSNCNFEGACLRQANMGSTEFRSVNFRGADLRNTRCVFRPRFTGSDLTDADFSNANLRSFDFRGAVLRNTDFTDAIVYSVGTQDDTRIRMSARGLRQARFVRSWREYAEGVMYTCDGIPLAQHRIVIARRGDAMVQWLREDPKRMIALGPQGLEDLVLDRLHSKNIAARSVGRVNAPDGGVDIVARFCDPIDFLMVIQIESHDAWNRKTGVGKARDFAGVVSGGPFDFGLLVTNTSFTKPTLDFLDSANISAYLRRAAYPELCQWLVGSLLTTPSLDARLGKEIVIPGGPAIELPHSAILDAHGYPVISQHKRVSS